MHFGTVFDIAQAGYKGEWLAGGLFIIAIGVLVYLAGGWPGRPRMPRWGVLAFALFWTTTFFAGTYISYVKARDAMLAGDYQIIEGRISGFSARPPDGNRESFVVAGRKFTYSKLAPGFANTEPFTAPISDGTYVRVTHHGDNILRLEIGR